LLEFTSKEEMWILVDIVASVQKVIIHECSNP